MSNNIYNKEHHNDLIFQIYQILRAKRLFIYLLWRGICLLVVGRGSIPVAAGEGVGVGGALRHRRAVELPLSDRRAAGPPRSRPPERGRV